VSTKTEEAIEGVQNAEVQEFRINPVLNQGRERLCLIV
jgi:hypothetical protein